VMIIAASRTGEVYGITSARDSIPSRDRSSTIHLQLLHRDVYISRITQLLV
jgi:hypothetical protein